MNFPLELAIFEASRTGVISTHHGSDQSDARGIVMADSEYKYCGKCGETKPRADFHRCRSKRDGLSANCKSCKTEMARAWRVSRPTYMRDYYIKNHERLVARSRDWYAQNRERSIATTAEWQRKNKESANARKCAWAKANPEKRSAANARWYAENREQDLENGRRWVLANPDKVAAKARRYQKRHPEKKRVRDAAYHASRRTEGHVSGSVWARVKTDSLGLCAYCNKRKPLTLDHIEPIARGGTNDPDNLAAICKSCNSSKNDTPLVIWLARRRLLNA